MVVYTNQAQEAGHFGSGTFAIRRPGREHLEEPSCLKLLMFSATLLGLKPINIVL
jgi:hypothetical protein